ncbi:MAG: hypothetical protein WD768_09975 [Phycisphaeraceae bacterium]
MSRRPHPTRAFTIVELLLVISIIVLLISITLPGLRKSRESARQVQCGINLREVGVACGVYDNDNLSYLPSHKGGGAHPFTTYWMNDSNASKLVRVNLGLLLVYVKDYRMYYDVSLEEDQQSALSYNGPDNPWNDSKGNNPAGNDFRLRSSYPARSLEVEVGGAGLKQWKVEKYRTKAIYSCFTGVDNWNGGGIINGRIMAAHYRRGNNVLYGDNSVLFLPMAVFEAYRAVGTSTPTATDMHQYYKRMDEER